MASSPASTSTTNNNNHHKNDTLVEQHPAVPHNNIWMKQLQQPLPPPPSLVGALSLRQSSHKNVIHEKKISSSSNAVMMIIPPDEDEDGSMSYQTTITTPNVLVVQQSPAEYLQSLLGLRSRAQPKRNRIPDELLQGYDMVAIRAIRDNDVTQLKAILAQDESSGGDSSSSSTPPRHGRRTLNACNRNGESLLHMACRRGSFPVIEYMLRFGNVDVTLTDDFGRSCLHDVCWRPTPHVEIMRLLLSRVPIELVLQEDVRGHTPWDYCRKEQYPIWIQFLQTQREDLLARLLGKEVVKTTTTTNTHHHRSPHNQLCVCEE